MIMCGSIISLKDLDSGYALVFIYPLTIILYLIGYEDLLTTFQICFDN